MISDIPELSAIRQTTPVTLAYLKGKGDESEEAQGHTNSSSLAPYAYTEGDHSGEEILGDAPFAGYAVGWSRSPRPILRRSSDRTRSATPFTTSAPSFVDAITAKSCSALRG